MIKSLPYMEALDERGIHLSC